MRVIWLVGADSSIKEELEKYLEVLRTGVPYRVCLASTFSEIPAEDIARNSTVFLLDAFHKLYPGFKGLREIRKLGFKGAVFLFGEPASESVTTPFLDDKLTGYFPAFDLADMSLVAGVVHYQIHFDGLIDVKLFLRPGGRATVENIRSFRDYNAFGAKLATFVGRFGVDISQLRKVLMGLSLGHIKTTPTGPEVEQPFPIFYGMDPEKLVIAAPTLSKGVTREAFMTHFCDVVGGLRNQKSLPGSMFPELYHVSRAAENLIVFSGNYQSETETMDPLVLVTTLSFPKIKEQPQAPHGVFAFCHSEPLEAEEYPPIDAPVAATADVAAVENLIVTENLAAESAQPMGTINGFDMKEILDEPLVIGDAPVFADPHKIDPSPLSKSAKAKAAAEVIEESGEEATGVMTSTPESLGSVSHSVGPVDNEELLRLKKLNIALAADVKRLMKERRQPTTDSELRDAVEQIQEKLKRSQLLVAATEAKVKEKEISIGTLKAQLESLKSKAA